jgi:hypothetical protein
MHAIAISTFVHAFFALLKAVFLTGLKIMDTASQIFVIPLLSLPIIMGKLTAKHISPSTVSTETDSTFVVTWKGINLIFSDLETRCRCS